VFDWVKLVLLVLRIIDKWTDDARDKGLITQGQDMELARVTTMILAKTEYAKDVRDRISKMDDAAVDAALRDLEPK